MEVKEYVPNTAPPQVIESSEQKKVPRDTM